MRSQASLALLAVALGCGSGSGSNGSGNGSDGSSGATAATGSGATSATSGGSTGMTGGTQSTSGTTTDSGDETTGGVDPPSPDGMPAGIPFPSFGYLHDTDVAPTMWVDNTNAACDDAQGTQAAPLCDLFAGTGSATFGAGTVVSILGGPYVIDGDRSLAMQGSADQPVIIKGAGDTKVRFDAQGNRADFTYTGSYGIVENIEFFDNTRHGVDASADHLVFRKIEVHNPQGAFIDFNPVFNVSGEDILIYESMIYDNRRDNDNDTHGIQAGAGSANVWILYNELYNNNGDSFQGCHECFADPPHHVYIGRNSMHDDRENAVDLKTIHDVVVSENVMYGYGSSTSSNGDAMVIGSNGYDSAVGQGPRNVWVLSNEFRDSANGVRIEGSEHVWVVGNLFHTLGQGLQIDNKEYGDLVISGNTMDGVGAGIYSFNDTCSAESVAIENNLITNSSGHHIEVPDCLGLSIANNLAWNGGGGFSVRVAGPAHTDAASLNGEVFASGNLDVDPQYEAGTLRPSAGSPAIDSGIDLEPYFEAVEAAYGGDAHFDLDGSPRPMGPSDIGAYEQ